MPVTIESIYENIDYNFIKNDPFYIFLKTFIYILVIAFIIFLIKIIYNIIKNKTKREIYNFSLLKGKIIIYIFYIIVLFLYFLFLTLSNYYISLTSCGLIVLFNNLFVSLIEKLNISLFGIITLESIWIIPLFLPTIFMSILYCEFIKYK